MSEYGVLSTGYSLKPLSVILAEIEAAMITEFGPGVIQTAQSPFGQINGLMASLIAEIEELNLDIYQSYDPDQAEGTRLDTLARMRQLDRNYLTDAQFRKLITNNDIARIEIADLQNAVASVSGVTSARVWVNDTTDIDNNGMPSGSVCVAVVGGDDADIASTVAGYMPPGSSLFGNSYAGYTSKGYCRSIPILRPIDVPVQLAFSIRRASTVKGCQPPSTTAIAEAFLIDWEENNFNGKDVSYHNVRYLLNQRWESVNLVSMATTRDSILTETASIAFIEISSIDDVAVTVIEGIPGEITE